MLKETSGPTKEMVLLRWHKVVKWVGICVYLRAYKDQVTETLECSTIDRIQNLSNPKYVCDCWKIGKVFMTVSSLTILKMSSVFES
jgi:hypothetical protein